MDSNDFLALGNGQFGLAVDATGLQTFGGNDTLCLLSDMHWFTASWDGPGDGPIAEGHEEVTRHRARLLWEARGWKNTARKLNVRKAKCKSYTRRSSECTGGSDFFEKKSY